MKYPPPKTRPQLGHGGEPLEYAELLVRVQDKIMDLVGEHPELGARYYFEIFGMFQDVLADELENFGADLAYHLFSRDKVLIQERAERYLAEEEQHRREEDELVKQRRKDIRERNKKERRESRSRS